MAEEADLSEVYNRLRRELLGRCFSDRSELRAFAEACGISVEPVEVVEGGARSVVLALRAGGLEEVLVRAARSQPWHPFYVTAVETP